MIFVTMLVSIRLHEFSVIRLTTRCDTKRAGLVSLAENHRNSIRFSHFKAKAPQSSDYVPHLGDLRGRGV